MKAFSSGTSRPALWEPAILLPTQLAQRNGCTKAAEIRLAAAVFEDALQCVTRNIDATSGPQWQELIDACDWIWNDSCDWLFAFVNVCALLGLDPAAVRSRLETVVARQARRVGRACPRTPAVVFLDARRDSRRPGAPARSFAATAP